jgi:hypothetical protein
MDLIGRRDGGCVVVALDVHDGRDEHRNDRHEDANRPTEDVPKPNPKLICDRSRNEQAEGHHGRCAGAEEREDASLHVRVDSGLHDRHEGSVGEYLHETDHEIGGKQKREHVSGDETDEDDAQPDANDAAEGGDDAAFEPAPNAEQDTAHDHADAENRFDPAKFGGAAVEYFCDHQREQGRGGDEHEVEQHGKDDDTQQSLPPDDVGKAFAQVVQVGCLCDLAAGLQGVTGRLWDGDEKQGQDGKDSRADVDQQYVLRGEQFDEQSTERRRKDAEQALQGLVGASDTRARCLSGTMREVEAVMAGPWNAPPKERIAMMA